MALPSWHSKCLDNIQKIGGTPCPELYCEQAFGTAKAAIHALCNCLPPYENGCKPVRTPDCCHFGADTPVPILSQECYCCCATLVSAVAVASDASTSRPIAEYRVGDPVYVADDASLRTWSQRTVMFSAGIGDVGGADTMVKVIYGTPELNERLVVNRAQLFLTPDRQLQPAVTLVPGRDALVSRTGEPRPVLALEDVESGRGLHHIATTTTPATSVDGHLILANNVVCVDWALQVSLATGGLASLAPGSSPHRLATLEEARHG